MNKKTKSSKKDAKRQAHKAQNFSWIIGGITIVTLLGFAIIINQKHAINTTARISSSVSPDNGDTKINWDRYETKYIQLSDSITITKSGTYRLTGTLENGLIKIDAKVGEIRLILDSVFINNNTGPAILCTSAEDLVIELIGNNIISDGTEYLADYGEDVTAAIYSKSDLTFGGTGSLTVTANYQDAIVGKDDVKFNNGTYNITSTDDAIRGKDSVYILNGNFIINSSADAIKTTNDTDHDKGFILIENGNFNITATNKAIKATKTILLNNGNYTIKTQYDDAIHSNNYVGISGGIYNINSGDDGIHSDQGIIIDGGEINIALAYEGIESQVITINGGTIRLNSNDDGINAGGGADKSAFNRIKGGPFPKDENSTITINNGDIYINSAGDGIDSNGWIYFNGGKTIVDGPTFNTDEALDASIGMVINGGEVFGVGADVSMEPLSSSSTIYNISVYLDSVKSANTKITIKDSNQNVVAEHQTIKTINHIAVGTPKFHLGETYSIYLNDELYDSFTITDITTEIIGNGVYNERYWMRK